MKNKIKKTELVNAYRKLGYKVSLGRQGRTSVYEEFKSPIDGSITTSILMFSTRPYDYDMLAENLEMTISQVKKYKSKRSQMRC